MDLLAEVLVKEGSVVTAVHLLEGVCQHQPTLPPQNEARIRLKLSQILAFNTENTKQARDHAMKALSILENERDCWELECHAYQLLGYSHRCLNDVKSQIDCYTRGLELCERQSPSLSMSAEKKNWYCQFAINLYETTAFINHSESAKHILLRAKEFAKTERNLKNMIWIVLILALHAWIDDRIGEISVLLEELRQLMENAHDKNHYWMSGYVYCALIQTSIALQTDDLTPYVEETTTDFHIFGELPCKVADVLNVLQSNHEWEEEFGWMSSQHIQAVLFNNFSRILLQRGYTSAALACIDSGLQIIERDPDSNLSQKIIFILLECRCRIHLFQYQFQSAKAVLDEIFAKLRPDVTNSIAGIRSSLHSLIGSYLQSLGLNRLAIAHYRRCYATSDRSKKDHLYAALSELLAPSNLSLSKAADLVYVYLQNGGERNTLYDLISGLIAERQGNYASASCSIHEATRAANAICCSKEMLATCHMNSGLMHLRHGDKGLAHSALQQAYNIALEFGDKFTDIRAKQELRSVMPYTGTKTTEEEESKEWTELCSKIERAKQTALSKGGQSIEMFKWDLDSDVTNVDGYCQTK